MGLVSTFYADKAAKLTVVTAGLVYEKLYNWDNIITVEIESGPLAEAFAGNMSMDEMTALGKDLLKQNAAFLLMAAAQATGQAGGLAAALNLFYSLMALLVIAKNDLILIFMKTVGKELVKAIQKKREVITDARIAMIDLYNVLITFAQGGPPVFDEFISRLRTALMELDTANYELVQVKGALKDDIWLSQKFKSVKERVAKAEQLTQPLDNKDNPYVKNWGLQTILLNAGFPSTDDQIAAMTKIPPMAAEVMHQLKGYLQRTAQVDALIVSYMIAMNMLTTKLPGFMKTFILNLLTQTSSNLNDIVEDMAQTLNGAPDAISEPASDENGPYEPVPLIVTFQAKKWHWEINLLKSVMETMIPAKQLDTFMLDVGCVNAYRNSVATLQGMGTVRRGNAILYANEAQENPATLEVQTATFMIEVLASVVSSSVRKEILFLGRTIIDRYDLTIERDKEIEAVVQSFIDTPIPLETYLEELQQALIDLANAYGCDLLADAFSKGEVEKWTTLNPTNANAAGAALAAIALIKECLGDNKEQWDTLENSAEEVAQDLELGSIKIAFNFDFAILDNLKQILSWLKLSEWYLEKEALCWMIVEFSKGEGVQKLTQWLEKKMDAISTEFNNGWNV